MLITTSNSSSKGSASASISKNDTGVPASDARSRAMPRNFEEVSIPTTWTPRRANSMAWRPGPVPTSSSRAPAFRLSALYRKSTSCSVPWVNS
jgi:hypothetical protein